MKMKITIDIPEEFHDEFLKDRFEDSLHRTICDIHCIAGQYEQETLTMLIKAFKDAEISNPAPMVRCLDCKHSTKWYGDKSRCFLWHDTGIDVFDDGFCSYGKKITEP